MSDDLISISAAARSLGLAPSTLSRQVADGKVRCHDGKRVRLSEVVADRKANVAYPVGISAPRPSTVNTVAQTGATVRGGATVGDGGFDDDDPIGPEPYTCITDILLTHGLVRQLAALIQSEEPDDLITIGQDLISIGGDILAQTILNQRYTFTKL